MKSPKERQGRAGQRMAGREIVRESCEIVRERGASHGVGRRPHDPAAVAASAQLVAFAWPRVRQLTAAVGIVHRECSCKAVARRCVILLALHHRLY